MNDVKLQEGHPVDENIRPLKVGGKSTALETAQSGSGCRITGDLEVTGDIKGNPISSLEIEDGLTTTGAILTLGTKEPTVVADDVLGRINFYAPLDTGTDSDEIAASIAAVAQDTFSDSVNSTALYFQTGKSEVATTKMIIDEDGNVGIGVTAPDTLLEILGTSTQLKLSHNAHDYATFTVANTGDLTIATAGDGSADSVLTLDADGDIILDAASDKIYLANAGTNTILFDVNGSGSAGASMKLMSILDDSDYFMIDTTTLGVTTISTVDDGGEGADLIFNIDGYVDINSASGENITLDSGGDITLDATGHVEFNNCGVGFDRLSGTFGTSGVIGSPNDGTDIDFRRGNKYVLTLTDDMGSDDLLNLIFPAVTGNFILVLGHDPGGGYGIDDAAWKAYASDASLADSTFIENGTDGEVRWAGGATPTLSANGRDIDIISIYWDADTQTAFAVASLDFAAV